MSFLEEYTLLEELGQGGFATVYKVRHNELGYIRAIRVLNATITSEQDPTYRKFKEECRLLLRLGNGNHPNIVHIYQPLLRAQKAIVEMDYVDGEDLFHYLERNKNFIPTEDVLRMLREIGSALAYCHYDIYRFSMDREEDDLKDDPNDGSKILLDDKTLRRLVEKYRVIHNDIHSGNIIRREDGSYVLLDFGLAIEGGDVVRSSRRQHGGAPEFKSPEKWEDETVLTTESDIYSFGVVLYELLAGRVPFQFDKSTSNIAKAEYMLSEAHRAQIPEPIEPLRREAFEAAYPEQTYEKDYPDWLEELIMKCLEKNPKDRFHSAKELFDYAEEQISNTKPKVEIIEKEVIVEKEVVKNIVVPDETAAAEVARLQKLTDGLQNKIDQLPKLIQRRTNFLYAVIFVLGLVAGFLFVRNLSIDDDIESSSKALSSMQQAIDDKEIRIESLTDSLSIANERLSTMSANESEMTAQLSDELRASQLTRDSLIRVIAEKDAALSSQNSTSNSEISRLRREKENAEKAKAAADKEIKKLKSQISAKDKQIADKNATIKKHETTIKKLQSDLFSAVN